MNSKVAVALAAYNEEDNIGPLLEKVLALKEVFNHQLKILVINDGSTDHTEQILADYSKMEPILEYISHPKNKGLGEAMKTMFEYIVKQYQDIDYVVTIDADNTHNPNIIPSLIDKLKREKLDVVVASRFVEGSEEIGVSWIRKLYSRGARVFFKVFFPITNIRDYSCGYRAYRVGYLRRAYELYNGQLVTSRGFESMAEILARFSKIGVTAGEYPLILEYNLKNGKSKLKVVETIKGYFKLIKKVKKPSKFY